MAGQQGTSVRKRSKPRKVKFFYFEGRLCKKLHINLANDIITVWCYPLHKRVAYSYTDVKRHRRKAFKTQEVAKLLDRTRLRIAHAIRDGAVKPPQFKYPLGNQEWNAGYYWSEDDVIELHQYFASIHHGRPRKDGMITPLHLIPLRELKAIMREESILYVKGEDGEFHPTWQAERM